MKKNSTITGIFLSLLLAMPAARAVVLTFDDISASEGTIINSQYNSSAFGNVTISADNSRFSGLNNPDLRDRAVVFDSTDNTPPAGVTDYDFDLVDPIGGPNDLGNVLIIQENTNGCTQATDTVCSDPDDEGRQPAGFFSFQFGQAIDLLSLDLIDVEAAENGTGPNNRIEVWQFGVTPDGTNGTIVGHTPNLGNNVWGQVAWLFDTSNPELRNLGRIDVYMGGSGALDNLEYSVVPVPAAFWLFGTALIGFICFSRRTSV